MWMKRKRPKINLKGNNHMIMILARELMMIGGDESGDAYRFRFY